MRPNLSEFSYGFALADNLIDSLGALCVNLERDTFDAEFSVESGRRRIKNCHTIKQ
jgi:hypothetical protein